ncbi:MAG: hypothetical protein ACREX4_13620 [Gammaproteobacteria bacterium]
MRWSLWPKPDFPRSATRKVEKEEVIRWLRSFRKATPRVTGTVTPLVRLIAEVTKHDPQLIHEGTRIVPELGLASLQRCASQLRLKSSPLFPVRAFAAPIPPLTRATLESPSIVHPRTGTMVTGSSSFSGSPTAGTSD